LSRYRAPFFTAALAITIVFGGEGCAGVIPTKVPDNMESSVLPLQRWMRFIVGNATVQKQKKKAEVMGSIEKIKQIS
jgi:hypothetical protein